MGLKTALDVLSEFIEEYESEGMSVQRVETRTSTGREGIQLHATLDLPIALCEASNAGLHPELSPQNATLTEEGIQVEFDLSVLSELLPASGTAVSTKKEGVRVSDDDTILLTVEVAVDATAVESETCELTTGEGIDRGLTSAPTSVQQNASSESEQSDLSPDLQSVRDDDVPPYEDTPYLEQLYDSCDTFVEMSERIEMDISAETVRRYMIDAGVHSPTTYDTAPDDQPDESRVTTEEDSTTVDSAAPSPVAGESPETLPDKELVTDGLGLPSDLQIEDVADAVVESMTLYEVQRHLDLGRQCTRDLLQQLDLLDLVMRRVDSNPEEPATYDEVAARIQQCAPAKG